MNPFIPAGYVATEFAVLTLACARDPHLWSDIPAAEQRIWTSRSSPRLSELVAYMKDEQLLPEVRSRAAVRWRSYLSAAELVQQLLFAGNLRAWFLDETKQLAFIEPEEWAGGERLTATLISGFDSVPHDAGEIFGTRRLFVQAPAIVALVEQLKQGQADLKACSGPANSEATRPVTRSRGGRPPKHDPEHVRRIVFELMDHNSDFTSDDSEWNCQARLEEAVRKKLKSSLAESRLRAAIRPHLEAWKAKARNS